MIESLLPLIDHWGQRENFEAVRHWYVLYGFWALLVKGITPVPYKLFTITAGAAAMPLLPFIAASCLSRGFRFFLVAYLVKWGGPAAEKKMLRHLDTVGWWVMALILGAIAYWVLR